MIRRSLFIIAGVLLIASSWRPVAAINYSTGTYGSCQYDTCSITMTTNGTVNVDVTPTAVGSCTIQKDAVAVTTDNSNGFTLMLQNSNTASDLTSASDTIATTSGSFASPIPLANTWGYRVDGQGGFGTGPTTAQNNTPPSGTTFAGLIPSTGTPDTIRSYTGTANPAITTDVWYGICADTSIHSGTYTSGVTYTAITND